MSGKTGFLMHAQGTFTLPARFFNAIFTDRRSGSCYTSAVNQSFLSSFPLGASVCRALAPLPFPSPAAIQYTGRPGSTYQPSRFFDGFSTHPLRTRGADRAILGPYNNPLSPLSQGDPRLPGAGPLVFLCVTAQLPATESTPSKMRSSRLRSASGRGGRSKDARFCRRCAGLPVPESTTCTPGSSRQKR